MGVTYEKRNQQRLVLGKIGFVIVILGIILFAIGMIGAFSGITDEILNITDIVVLALCTLCFGIFFTLIFGRIGWHDNPQLDFLLNQVSVILAIVGVSVALIVIAFFALDEGVIFGLVISIFGFSVAAIGIRLNKAPS